MQIELTKCDWVPRVDEGLPLAGQVCSCWIFNGNFNTLGERILDNYIHFL